MDTEMGLAGCYSQSLTAVAEGFTRSQAVERCKGYEGPHAPCRYCTEARKGSGNPVLQSLSRLQTRKGSEAEQAGGHTRESAAAPPIGNLTRRYESIKILAPLLP